MFGASGLARRNLDDDDEVNHGPAKRQRHARSTSHPLLTPDASTPTTGGVTPADDAGHGGSLICYGAITKINAQLLDASQHASNRAGLDAINAADGQSEYVSLQLTVKGARLVLSTPSCLDIAHLNSKVTAAFQEILKRADIQIRPFVKRTDLEFLLQANVTNKKKNSLLVNATIIGPQYFAHETGTSLSKQGLYLQDPVPAEPTMAYINPQLFEFDVDDIEFLFQELVTGSSALASSIDVNPAWTNMLGNLPQHGLDSTAVNLDPAVVRTNLMPHQGEALDFMRKRELGGGLLDTGARFWLPHRTENAIEVHRHRITADERQGVQDEPRGGILADEMGLGKTLTTLSLIISSRDRAEQYARSQPPGNAFSQPRIVRAPSAATLIIVPSTQLMDSWIKQLQQHTRVEALRISTYHAQNRVTHYTDLLKFDIVLTTYGTIAREYRKREREVLYHMRFFRVVLDEAHTIRNRRTKLFTAINTLDAAHYWCLTGTPVSNKIDDLGALLEFCRVPLLEDAKTFRRHIATPARKSFKRGCYLLRETLTPLCLRRTQALIGLAKPELIEKLVDFTRQELSQYRRIIKAGRDALDAPVSGRPESSRNVVPRLLLKLRIFCNQGTYSDDRESLEQDLDPDEHFTLLEEQEQDQCVVCFSTITGLGQTEDEASGILGECGHVICLACHSDSSEGNRSTMAYNCPLCKERTRPRTLSAGNPANSGAMKHSSKLNALMHELTASQNADPPEKSIVFSSWRKTIGLARQLCAERGVRAVQIDGETSHADRSRILDQFAADASISALLMTIGTGGLGLTITSASRVHILEPQWNPSVEDQAIGRVVRLGQAKPITVIRYIIQDKDSVEKHIQGYQKQKINLAASGFEAQADSLLTERSVRLDVRATYHPPFPLSADFIS
ncbi:hypothetical protein CKM354_000996000 [Cercospora kikuchii]|uniref:Uncharacterized protein n=1 Tax=Cercospora kikuchii TaxID=84275 RepID=A0A9P3CQK7_9PEZI|nr:uncharacterized protein CKM354_000996000 [Cercospora kikuchii]GIZ46851.1 hypothetical protein CKM354_000996000 [Cercospora kikuchii]